MFKLNNLRAPVGSNHAPKRKGKGIGSGLGKTAGKGHKGQRARSGGGKIGHAFEGGQMPLSRRSPKVGFNSPLKANKVIVNISDLGDFAGQDLTAANLVPKSKVFHSRKFIAVVGTKAPKSFPKSIEAHKVAPKTRELLEAQGVSIKILEHKDGARSVRPDGKKAK